MMGKRILILASRSPRRAAILQQLGIPFEVRVSQVQEENFQGTLAQRVERLALAKAQAVAKEQEGLILGADTLVSLDDKILGKPQDAEHAARMLSLLSGRVHQVMTGLALVEGRELCGHQLTHVKMRKLSVGEIERYVATGEPLDKAGAYGIQGRGAALVEEIAGCYYNVVGLPVALLLRQLASFGITVP
jgi:septum formation protein